MIQFMFINMKNRHFPSRYGWFHSLFIFYNTLKLNSQFFLPRNTICRTMDDKVLKTFLRFRKSYIN